jgi:RES domain-containing protein
MLEKLVHANLVLPANQHYICITIPNGVSYEVFQTADHPGWDSKSEAICKTFGQDWCIQIRSALLMVPSIPARVERNILINPAHADAKGITYSLPEPVWWDDRLYHRDAS